MIILLVFESFTTDLLSKEQEFVISERNEQIFSLTDLA